MSDPVITILCLFWFEFLGVFLLSLDENHDTETPASGCPDSTYHNQSSHKYSSFFCFGAYLIIALLEQGLQLVGMPLAKKCHLHMKVPLLLQADDW